jgi:hypothetical protein
MSNSLNLLLVIIALVLCEFRHDLVKLLLIHTTVLQPLRGLLFQAAWEQISDGVSEVSVGIRRGPRGKEWTRRESRNGSLTTFDPADCADLVTRHGSILHFI